MSLISKLTPINLLEEKEKFFADESYNPQFIYGEEINPMSLTKYGIPNPKYLDLAHGILNQAYHHQNETALRQKEGPIATQSQVNLQVKKFLQMHQIENKFKIIWSHSFVARTTINPNIIKLRLPCDFRQNEILSMLYHEIGTHALRRINYEQQPWYKKKKKHNFHEYLKTEEGLANLNSMLPKNFQLIYFNALHYLAVDYAQSHSFSQLWQFLKPFIDDPERRWIMTFRKKRGLRDTSQPGGFTKDLLYFEGAVDVWHYLKQNNFDITNLYFGKMALEDVERAIKMNPNFEPLLPSFFVVNKMKYAEKIAQIGQINHL